MLFNYVPWLYNYSSAGLECQASTICTQRFTFYLDAMSYNYLYIRAFIFIYFPSRCRSVSSAQDMRTVENNSRKSWIGALAADLMSERR